MPPDERVVTDIRRVTRRYFSAEGKIRIVLDGLRGEDIIAELCHKEGNAQSLLRRLVQKSSSKPASAAPQVIPPGPRPRTR